MDEVRYLINRGYDKESAILFVSNHHTLLKKERAILIRVAVPQSIAKARIGKLRTMDALNQRTVFVDGYNVLITVDSLLLEKEVYLCDDLVLRDIRGIYGKLRKSEFLSDTIELTLSALLEAKPRWTQVLLDKQVSYSADLAHFIDVIRKDKGLPGIVRTIENVDFYLKNAPGVVASSDGIIIDFASDVVDVPKSIAKRGKLNYITI